MADGNSGKQKQLGDLGTYHSLVYLLSPEVGCVWGELLLPLVSASEDAAVLQLPECFEKGLWNKGTQIP